MAQLRDVWEATGFRLEREQAAEETVEAERRGLAAREAPRWALPYTPTWTPDDVLAAADKPRVAILRWIASSVESFLSLLFPALYFLSFAHHLLWKAVMDGWMVGVAIRRDINVLLQCRLRLHIIPVGVHSAAALSSRSDVILLCLMMDFGVQS